MTGTALAVIATGAVAWFAYAVLASSGVQRADADRAGARPVAGDRASVPAPSATPKPAATPTPDTSASPTAKASSASPSPRPSATRTTAAPRAVSATAPLAGRIRPAVTYKGVATFYDTGNGDGACTFGPTSDVMTAAMNTADYESSKACGAYVLVRAADGASVTVRITNECPAPCAPGQLDLSPQAFAELAAPSRGQIPITWTLQSPADPGPMSLRYKTGSTRYWCGVQVIGHRNPVARLEVRSGSGWHALPRADYDYFLSENGTGCGGAIRVTDIYGEQLTVATPVLKPDTVQPAGVQFTRH
ncbi:expansin EXLX1 family cellulose-binding protein [Streptomyces sp. NPDC005423]|uniref:expansin EXLX1 family cellulose-binding protein n=1 Tax=Streptomyces sp. NPDC005423 TaxID=3155343 RepID=UPI0033ADF2BB